MVASEREGSEEYEPDAESGADEEEVLRWAPLLGEGGGQGLGLGLGSEGGGWICEGDAMVNDGRRKGWMDGGG